MKGSGVVGAMLLVIAGPAIAADNAELSATTIVQKCMDQMRRTVRLKSSYTFKYLDETTNLSRSGQPKDSHRKLVEVVYFAGKEHERLLQKDGKPLPPADEKREEEKMNRAAREAATLTEEQKAARQAKYDREREKDYELLQFVVEAFDFSLQPAVTLNGRPTYVLDAKPKENYRGKYAGTLRKIKARMFIDKADFNMARMEADLLEPISVGLFLGKLNQGARVTLEHLRVNDEIWLPKSFTFHADARALVKTYRVDGQRVYSDYRKFQAESRIVSIDEK